MNYTDAADEFSFHLASSPPASPEPNVLTVTFVGAHTAKPGERFEELTKEVHAQLSKGEYSRVDCHFEDTQRLSSSTQAEIIRFISEVHPHTQGMKLYGRSGNVFQKENLQILRLISNELSKDAGPAVELVEVQEAS